MNNLKQKINNFIKKDYKSPNLNCGFMINPYVFRIKGPITIDTTVTSNSTLTPSITIGSNSNRLIIVSVGYKHTGAASISSITCGALSLTKATTSNVSGGFWYEDIWYGIAPPTGSQTVTVTFASGSPAYAIGIASLYNCDQSTGINTSANNTAGANSTAARTINVTPTNTSSWILAAVMDENNTSGLSSPNKTNFFAVILDSSSANFRHVMQYYSAPTINSANTLSWAGTAGGHWNIVGIEVMAG